MDNRSWAAYSPESIYTGVSPQSAEGIKASPVKNYQPSPEELLKYSLNSHKHRAIDLFAEGVRPCKDDISKTFGDVGCYAITAGYMLYGAMGSVFMFCTTALSLLVITPLVAGLKYALPYLMRGRAGLIADDLQQARARVEDYEARIDHVQQHNGGLLQRVRGYLSGYTNQYYHQARAASRKRSNQLQAQMNGYLQKQRQQHGLALYHSPPAECLKAMQNLPEQSIAYGIKQRGYQNRLLHSQKESLSPVRKKRWQCEDEVYLQARDRQHQEHYLMKNMKRLATGIKQVDGLVDNLELEEARVSWLSQLFSQAGKRLYYTISWWRGEPIVRE